MRTAHWLKFVASLVCCLGCASAPTTPAPALPTSAQAGATTIVAIAPSPGSGTTLPQFLGLSALGRGLGALSTRIRSRLGYRFPGLEPRPAMKPIADPSNLSEDSSPAVQAAAEAKMAEDEGPQKAKAVRYLASLGCGKCYPDTEDALVAALEDCIEAVRYEAVSGLRKNAGRPCKCCKFNSCCTPKVIKKLNELAYGTDECGCCLEPSARVRRMARLALNGCGGASAAVEVRSVPLEGPTAAEGEFPAGVEAVHMAPASNGAISATAAPATFTEAASAGEFVPVSEFAIPSG